jgi:hypothetical protein
MLKGSLEALCLRSPRKLSRPKYTAREYREPFLTSIKPV